MQDDIEPTMFCFTVGHPQSVATVLPGYDSWVEGSDDCKNIGWAFFFMRVCAFCWCWNVVVPSWWLMFIESIWPIFPCICSFSAVRSLISSAWFRF